ncbi:MAG: ATP-binding protein [Nitrososphaerales archaeon]
MMNHHHDDDSHKIISFSAETLHEVELMPHLRATEELMFKTTHYFFSNPNVGADAPFKGFLVNGPVGTGKTELVKQVARRVALTLKDSAVVKLVPVDSAVVASPKWGESEAVFQKLFSFVNDLNLVSNNNAKVIFLFDDIESLLLSRGMSASREWHFSLNSVLFHLLDNMNPNQSILFGTTNRMDLMDPALSTRLYGVKIPSAPVKTLLNYSSKMLDSMLGDNPKKAKVLKDVKSKLIALKTPSIRDCRQITIISSIEQQALNA